MAAPARWINTGQAAALAGVHRHTIAAWIRSGRLRGRKLPGITGDWLFRPAMVQAAAARRPGRKPGRHPAEPAEAAA